MTWLPGMRITAQRLNDISGLWVAYTPAWSSSGTQPAIGNGTITGRYALTGGTVDFVVKVTMGSTTTYGTGNYSFSLPFTAAAGADMIGDVFVGDSSVGAGGYSGGGAVYITTGATDVSAYVGATGATSVMGATAPQTFASGDRIWIQGRYEAA
jgi:hypothetical protein